MTDTQQVWLTHEAYARLQGELSLLRAQQSNHNGESLAESERDRDHNALDDDHISNQWERTQRIRKIQDMLERAVVDEEPPDDGVAEPGMVVTVQYADDPEPETFLMADHEHDLDGDLEVCSPESPLGMALLGAKQGEQRTYRLPRGDEMTVSLVRAVPYGHHVQPT